MTVQQLQEKLAEFQPWDEVEILAEVRRDLDPVEMDLDDVLAFPTGRRCKLIAGRSK